MTNDERQAIYESLLEESLNGELKKGSIGPLATKFGVNKWTISRIWHLVTGQVLDGSTIDVSSKKINVVGRKRVEIDLS